MLREILTEMKLMRSLLLSTVMLMTVFTVQAQQNYGIAYQAVARDADGDALEFATLDVRFTLTDAVAGAAVWTETHNGVMTDEFGLINLTIGSVEGGSGLPSVDWADGGFEFQVEVNSGNGFESFGSLAVTSVPVALYASSAPEPTADSLASVTAQEAADRAAADAAHDSAISTNATSIAANSARSASNAAAIASNDTDIATNATAVADEAAARAAADAAHDSAISTNATSIAANSASSASNAAAIASNDTDIAANEAAIAAETAARTDTNSALH